MPKIKIYDTTLRDGSQAEGVSFSLEDKILIARRLDEFGMDYVEGGFPQSNPKEASFFREMVMAPLKQAKLAAFGSTSAGLIPRSGMITGFGRFWNPGRRPVRLSANAGSVCAGWPRCSYEDNLKLCADSVAYLVSKGKDVIFDAEHF